MPTLDVSYEPISKPILDPDNSLYALFPKSHDDPRHPKHRNHEGSKYDQEEQQQQSGHSCVVTSKEWLDEVEASRKEPGPILYPKDELKSISLINMTHPILEEALDKINLRVTNPREILDIHEKSILELEKQDGINEHGSYFMTTSSNSCSHEKSPELIDLSTIAHEIFNPLILPVHKNSKRVVVDAFVYHKFCKSHCMLS